MNNNLFLAMDEDDSGVLQCSMVEDFVRSFLRGHQIPNMADTSFEDCHASAYSILQEEESQEVTPDMMAKFMNKLIKNQIVLLQESLEKQKADRALDLQQEEVVIKKAAGA